MKIFYISSNLTLPVLHLSIIFDHPLTTCCHLVYSGVELASHVAKVTEDHQTSKHTGYAVADRYY